MPNLARAILGETGSEAGVGEFLEGKGYRHLMAGTAGDGFGELHVADAGGEVGVRDRTLTQDRCHEVVLDTPAAFQLSGTGRKFNASSVRRAPRISSRRKS